MTHLGFAVDDLEKTVANVSACGAKKAQYSPDEWIVMLDPEGASILFVPE